MSKLNIVQQNDYIQIILYSHLNLKQRLYKLKVLWKIAVDFKNTKKLKTKKYSLVWTFN